MSEFKREERYIVIKRKHLTDIDEEFIRAVLVDLNVRCTKCVVVESDWPEYEKVWNMLEERISSSTLIQKQQAEIKSLKAEIETDNKDLCDMADLLQETGLTLEKKQVEDLLNKKYLEHAGLRKKHRKAGNRDLQMFHEGAQQLAYELFENIRSKKFNQGG